MAPDDKTKHTKHSFLLAGISRTQEDITRENKMIKDSKKEVNNIAKTSCEAIEEMTKTSANSAARMEEQMTKIGQNITESSRETQSSITKLAQTLQALLAPLANSQQPSQGQNPSIQPPEPHTEEIESQSPPAQQQQPIDPAYRIKPPRKTSQNWQEFHVEEEHGLVHTATFLQGGYGQAKQSHIQSTHHDEPQIVLPRHKKAKRPNLLETTEQQVSQDLAKQFDDKYRGENIPKTRAQKTMTEEQRQETIDNMLDKAGYRLGIAPFTSEHMQRVDRILSSKGLYLHDDTPAIRKKNTAIIKSWAFKHLHITQKDWDNITIEDLALTDNSDIVFLHFLSKEDVSKFTSHAKYLPKDHGSDGPRLIMYVDSCAMKHHKAFISIAKSIREHCNITIQTSIRTGKHNFLLRTRPKGSDTPWSEIAPIQITQEILEFEIGMYRDIINPHNNPPEYTEEPPN